MLRVLVSQTGYQSGFGRDKHKYICGLTREEKKFAKEGGAVLIRSTPHLNGRGGVSWRVAVWDEYSRRFLPRVPTGPLYRYAESLTLEQGEVVPDKLQGTMDLI